MEQHIIYGALAFFAGVVLYIVIEKRLQEREGLDPLERNSIERPTWYYLGTGVAISLIISGGFIFYLISRNQRLI